MFNNAVTSKGRKEWFMSKMKRTTVRFIPWKHTKINRGTFDTMVNWRMKIVARYICAAAFDLKPHHHWAECTAIVRTSGRIHVG